MIDQKRGYYMHFEQEILYKLNTIIDLLRKLLKQDEDQFNRIEQMNKEAEKQFHEKDIESQQRLAENLGSMYELLKPPNPEDVEKYKNFMSQTLEFGKMHKEAYEKLGLIDSKKEVIKIEIPTEEE